MTGRRLRIDHLIAETSLFVEDDLIEIDSPAAERTRTRTRNTMNVDIPHPDAWPMPDLASIPGLIPQPQPRRATGRRAPEPTHSQSAAPVIDLTEEPDSPVRERPRRNSTQPPGRNPRRTNSQRISPPRLARSDSTFFGASASVIDLTVDSPEESRPSDSTRSRTAHHRVRPHPDELIELEFISSGPISSGPRRVPNFAIGLTRRLAGILGAEIMGAEFLGFNQPQLDISRNAFAPREPSPKPPMEPIPPTREGFSRETCTDPEKESETIVICPACNEELAYDPTEPVVHTSPSGGKKRKRSPGEHHFWALKKCGHVYCADCFENRRPTKTNPVGAGFRAPEGKHPYNVPNELRCVVDDCETKVSAKGEWVGIFL